MNPESFAVRHVPDMPGLEVAAGVTAGRGSLNHIHGDYRIGVVVSGGWSSQTRGVRYDIGPARPGDHSLCEFRDGESSAYRTISLEPSRLGAGEVPVALKSAFGHHVVVDPVRSRAFASLHHRLMGASTALEGTTLAWQILAAFMHGEEGLRAEPTAIRRAREWLDDDPAGNMPLHALADVAELSPYHFLRSFKAATGLPPHAYRPGRSSAHGKRLLSSGLPASDTAIACGFADQSHFIRHSRRFTGQTPRIYALGLRSSEGT
jgi:AraC-like DNA-binding protein